MRESTTHRYRCLDLRSNPDDVRHGKSRNGRTCLCEVMSPTSDEATSPRATENMSSYSPTHRTLSTPTDFGTSPSFSPPLPERSTFSADKVVEDVLDDASEEEVDESILLGHELWAALASRPFEERSMLHRPDGTCKDLCLQERLGMEGMARCCCSECGLRKCAHDRGKRTESSAR